MSVDLERTTGWSGPEQELHYRAVSPMAVASCLIGMVSSVTFFDWTMFPVSIVGTALGVVAWRQIQRRPSELTGKRLAQAGVALSLGFLLVGGAVQGYTYATEVPTGYERITFTQLQPETGQTGQLAPPSALDLDGKRVFLKGYVFPSRQRTGIKDFLLVWNNGDCCFGGNPPLTHMVRVRLESPLELTYTPSLHRVAGTFHVKTGEGLEGIGSVVYHLDADYLK